MLAAQARRLFQRKEADHLNYSRSAFPYRLALAPFAG